MMFSDESPSKFLSVKNSTEFKAMIHYMDLDVFSIELLATESLGSRPNFTTQRRVPRMMSDMSKQHSDRSSVRPSNLVDVNYLPPSST